MIEIFKKAQNRVSFGAFSLIELLISLIIISLLVAAFAPIITKKLKASDISIGSFGSGSNINMTLERQVTKEDCDKYDALFIPAAMNGGVRNLCVTKYNMGDNDLPLAGSVKKLTVGNTCTDKDKGSCCWSGNTSTTCTTGKNGDGDYSGCNRTVCQFAAANASCASYDPNDENEGSWRLPNKDELANWSSNLVNINNNKGKEGLQLCDASSSALGSNQCDFKINGCPTNGEEGIKNGCYPDLVWSLTASEDDSDTHYANTLTNGAFNANKYNQNYAFSARCVLDHINVDISELPGNGIKDPTTDPFYGEPKDQADCDKIVGIFIDKKMSGANRNICVSKYNVGDAGPDGFGPPIPDGYDILSTGGPTCPLDGHCCWRGKTSGTCGLDGNAGANYSGCNRTVCQWYAANSACRQYNAFGATAVGAWRLPKSSEISVWSVNKSTVQINKGANGLQLCAAGSNTGFVRCDQYQNCGNAQNGYCYPNYFWSGTETKADFHNAMHDNFIGVGGHQSAHAFSARCVYDGITKANNYEDDLSDYDDTNGPADEPKSQADCDKLTAIFVHKKYAGGMRNLCVSKYNVGDSGPSGSGPSIPSAYTDYTIATGGASCPLAGYCCWKGKTSGTCSIGGNAGADYSGCNRTVCQWYAANEACLLWTAGGKTPAGSWRLPTQMEFTSFSNYKNIIQIDRGKDGLQLCAEGSNTGFARCDSYKNCSSRNGFCYPNYFWSGTEASTDLHNAMHDNFIGVGGHQSDHAFSARCVYDGTTRKIEIPTDYDDTNAPSDEPKSQADCDKLTAIFVHKKYAGGMRNLCVSKYNVGDSGPSGSGPGIPGGDYNLIMTGGLSCPKSGYCCWKGKTSGTCTIVGNAGADYSGCNRTVCQWYAANAACRAHTAGGKTQAGYWRLPTQMELAGFSNYKNIIQTDRGKDGLQLCIGESNTGFVRCSSYQNCSNARNGFCYPNYFWSGTETAANMHAAMYDNFVALGGHQSDHAFSARCVYDGQKYN